MKTHELPTEQLLERLGEAVTVYNRSRANVYALRAALIHQAAPEWASSWQLMPHDVWRLKLDSGTIWFNLLTGELIHRRKYFKAETITKKGLETLKKLYDSKEVPKPPKPYKRLRDWSSTTQIFKPPAHSNDWNKEQKEIGARLPPIDIDYRAHFRYDATLDRLVGVWGDHAIIVDHLDDFVEVQGEMYATWRIKSMVVYGNPFGHSKDVAKVKEMLDQVPINRLLIPPGRQIYKVVDNAEKDVEDLK